MPDLTCPIPREEDEGLTFECQDPIWQPTAWIGLDDKPYLTKDVIAQLMRVINAKRVFMGFDAAQYQDIFMPFDLYGERFIEDFDAESPSEPTTQQVRPWSMAWGAAALHCFWSSLAISSWLSYIPRTNEISGEGWQWLDVDSYLDGGEARPLELSPEFTGLADGGLFGFSMNFRLKNGWKYAVETIREELDKHYCRYYWDVVEPPIVAELTCTESEYRCGYNYHSDPITIPPLTRDTWLPLAPWDGSLPVTEGYPWSGHPWDENLPVLEGYTYEPDLRGTNDPYPFTSGATGFEVTDEKIIVAPSYFDLEPRDNSEPPIRKILNATTSTDIPVYESGGQAASSSGLNLVYDVGSKLFGLLSQPFYYWFGARGRLDFDDYIFELIYDGFGVVRKLTDIILSAGMNESIYSDVQAVVYTNTDESTQANLHHALSWSGAIRGNITGYKIIDEDNLEVTPNWLDITVSIGTYNATSDATPVIINTQMNSENLTGWRVDRHPDIEEVFTYLHKDEVGKKLIWTHRRGVGMLPLENTAPAACVKTVISADLLSNIWIRFKK